MTAYEIISIFIGILALLMSFGKKKIEIYTMQHILTDLFMSIMQIVLIANIIII